MNATINITEIISIIITLLGAIITAFVIPYIRSKTNDAQYNLIKTIVNTSVYFAESFFKAYGQGEEKRAYVFEYVQEKCNEIGIAFDEVAVLQMIEEAWIGLTGGKSGCPQIVIDADINDEDEIVSE